MTSQPTSQSVSPRVPPLHLTEEQFGELLSAPRNAASPAEAHLLACEQCAAEFASLRDSLFLFRHATSAYANDQLRSLPPLALPARPLLSPAFQRITWTATAALILAAILPLQMLHHHTLPATVSTSVSSPADPGESDQALLEDINRDVSASVPTSMQALDNPVALTANESSTQNSTQRKD